MQRARLAALAALLVIPAVIGVRTVGRANTEVGPAPTAAAAVKEEVAIAAEVRPMSVSHGEPVSITVAVRSMAWQPAAVGLELYDPAGGRALQRFWDGRAMAAGEDHRWRATWIVPSDAPTGAWTVKVGVFDAGGGGLVAWNHAAARLFTFGGGGLVAWNHAAARLTVRLARPPTAPPSTAPPTTTTPPADPTASVRFETLPPGAGLPSGARCAQWVQARPLPERKGVNRVANQATGHRLAAALFDPGATDPGANRLAARVDGAFTGTTEHILRWAACKWGVDEDLVRAQAAVESWWRQTTMGDWAGDAAACPPGHGLSADGRPGQCPQSYGILQNRYPYERSAWPGIERSTAMNADIAYAIWRACFEGYERWLNDVEQGRPYASGDAWGCVGRWLSGRWHTQAAEGYISNVKGYLRDRVWDQSDFQEP
jgi:hypothetical protein